MEIKQSSEHNFPVKIHLLGQARLTVDAYTQPLPASPATNLLGYLALYASKGQSVSRSRLAGILFPDESETRARRMLSELLYRLRKTLKDQVSVVLKANEERLALNKVWVDVHEFNARAASSNLEDWRYAIDLYAGELLEDCEEEWVLGQRAALHETYLTTLENTASAYADAGSLMNALRLAHRWVLADPLREEAYRLEMKLYAQMGRYAAAIEVYNNLTQLLDQELGVVVLPETALLADTIRDEMESRASPPRRRLFVGRKEERAELLNRLDQLSDPQSGIILVEGDPGIGKTRLLEEAAESAQWRKITAAWGRADQFVGASPYSPLDSAFQVIFSGPRWDQVAAQMIPSELRPLNWLLRRSPETSAEPSPGGRSEFVSALAGALRIVARQSPLLILLDDVQWAGEGFWEILPELNQQTTGCRLIWVLAYRPAAVRARHTAWDCLRALDRQSALTKIILSGLSTEDCGRLAAQLGHPINSETAWQLREQTQGSPLLLIESLAQPEPVSGYYEAMIADRLALLFPAARAALEIAAVLGREFSHHLWLALACPTLDSVIPVLLDSRFLEETAQGYRFSHDLTREYVYRAIPPSRLRDLHLTTAEMLQKENARPGVLAWHFEQAGRWADAIRALATAGSEEMAAHAYTPALADFNHAIDLLAYLPENLSLRVALLRQRQRILGALLRVQEWQRDIDEIDRVISRTETLSEAEYTAAFLDCLEARITLEAMNNHIEAAIFTARLAVDVANRVGNLPTRARIESTVGKVMRAQIAPTAESERHLVRAVEIAEAAGDLRELVTALCVLSGNQTVRGRPRRGWESASRALAIIEQHPGLEPLKAHALQELGHASAFLAEYEVAQTSQMQAIELHLRAGHLWEMGQTAFNYIVTDLSIGQFQAALNVAEMVLAMMPTAGIDPIHSDVGVMFQQLKAQAMMYQGHPDEAEVLLQQLPNPMESTTLTRPVYSGLLSLCYLYFIRGQHDQALAAGRRLVELLPQDRLFEHEVPWLNNALSAFYLNRMEEARANIDHAGKIMSNIQSLRSAIRYSHARFLIYGSPDDLRDAYIELQREASLFKDEQLRADFLKNVWDNREVLAAYQAQNKTDASITARLARANTPLGKRLKDEERVEVRWTVDEGPADEKILRTEGKVALRHHRLKRLIAQAEAQGAAPTDADLAQALGVTLRTIERDMQILSASGSAIHTRKRAKQAAIQKKADQKAAPISGACEPNKEALDEAA